MNFRPLFLPHLPLAALACLAIAPLASAETLSEACASTLVTHPVIAADRAAVKVAEANVSVARSGFFPTLSAVGDANLDSYFRGADSISLQGRSALVQAQQMLYDGFQTASHTQAAEQERLATTEDLRRGTNDVLLSTVRAYLGVLRNRELLAAAKANVEAHDMQVKRVQDSVALDEGKGFDLKQVQMREALASSYVEEQTGALQTAESQYLEIVGHPVSTLLKPGRLKITAFHDLPSAIALGEAKHPTVVAANQRFLRRQSELNQAQGALQPRLDLTARYVKGYDIQGLPGGNDEAFAGLEASYAFPTGGATLATVQGARETLSEAQADIDVAKRDVRENVRVAWIQRETLETMRAIAEDHLTRSKEVVEGYHTKYDIGRLTVLDLLLVQDEEYQAEAQVISVGYDLLLADFSLASQMGLLPGFFSAHGPTPAHATKATVTP